MNPTEMSTSRWKTIWYLCVSLTFVAIALLLLQNPDRDAWKLQACLGFFGLYSIAFVWLLIRPRRLLLDKEGFTVLGGFVRSPKMVHWRDIDEFFVYSLPRGGKMIGFNYKPDAREISPMARFNQRFGADGALPRGWAQSPEKMVAELNAYRLRALGTGNATVATV